MRHSSDLSLLQSKTHYHVLDGLRGIAALAVVVFHFMEWIYPIEQNFIGYGFLAVDFFFCLSGFVIAYAYDNRISKMGIRAFFTSRLIRLHPLVVAGAVLGLIGLLVDPFADHAATISTTSLVLIFFGSLLMIPLPLMEARAFNLFSLNAPGWSLFWEYVAIILYAFVLVRLPRKVLWGLLLVSAAGIIWVGQSSGHLLGGWNGETFFHGGIRMAYSFLAGLLIYRLGWIINNKLGFVVLSVMLAAAFLVPAFAKGWWTEVLIVLVYFPLIVALGAGSVLSGAIQKVCVFMGNISYPLYMTHYVGIWWFGNYFISRNPSPELLPWIIGGGTVAMVFFAWLVMVAYDIPIRNYLSRKRSEKKKR